MEHCTRAQALYPDIALVLTCNWLLHLAPTSAQDGLDPLQPALVYGVFLPSPIAQILHLQLALVVCFYQLVHLLMCECIY